MPSRGMPVNILDCARRWRGCYHLKSKCTSKVMDSHSHTHYSAVVGDTVDDPLKNTVGPSLHVVVKLLATVTLVMCPLFI